MTQQKHNLAIGQIIYILSNKGQVVIPAMVVEEQTIQTLEGTNVSWKVAIGAAGDKQKIVESTKLNGEIFVSLEDIKDLLTKRLSRFVEGVVTDAKKRETIWYGKIKQDSKVAVVPKQIERTNKIDPESLLEGMDDIVGDNDSGNGLNENMASIRSQINFSQFTEQDRQISLKEKLRQSIMPSGDSLRGGIDEGDETSMGSGVMPGPDGQPIKYNIKA